MAEKDDSRGSTTHTSSNCQHLQGGGGSNGFSNSSSMPKQNHDQDDHKLHHHKKSVLMRVKEKARKLKRSLSGKKHRDENEPHSPCITPPGPLNDDRPEHFGPNDDQPEYFGSPLYEPQEIHDTTDKEKKSLYSDDKDADSKQSGLTTSTHEESEQSQDKGVSVKEYIMHKFEPGDDERALSQVITQTISPKCKKVKEAVNSLLRNEEASESTSKNSNLELDSTHLSSLNESADQKLTSNS